MHEFLEVFPDDLFSMPPDPEIDFFKDIDPRTYLVFITPYHMTLVKLKELKSQFQELL